MRRTTSLSIAGLLGLAVLAPMSTAGPASAAGETCRGEAATIVGTTPTLTGTEGRDVIVTGRATEVRGLGGDDLICVVPIGTNVNVVEVDAGAGDDLVDTTTARNGFYITSVLGTGADTFVGGGAGDWVFAGTGPKSRSDSEVDRIDTGDGADRVHSGEPGTPNRDSISLGDGTDTLSLDGPIVAPEAVLDAGSDSDRVEVHNGSTDAAIDLLAGTLTTTAGTHPIGSFESATFTAGSSQIAFRGTEGVNLLTVRSESGTPALQADLGGGDDAVHLEPAGLAAGSRIDAGEGSDQLVAATERGFLKLDLERALLRTGSATSVATGFEHGFLMAPEGVLVGDDQDNLLRFHGCEATLRGGGGDDYLGDSGDYVFDSYSYGCKARLTVHGGPGADEIRGGSGADRIFGGAGGDTIQGRGGADRIHGGTGKDVVSAGGARDHVWGDRGHDVLKGDDGNDVLLGGPGRDKAVGGKGRDRCVAERKRSCER